MEIKDFDFAMWETVENSEFITEEMLGGCYTWPVEKQKDGSVSFHAASLCTYIDSKKDGLWSLTTISDVVTGRFVASFYIKGVPSWFVDACRLDMISDTFDDGDTGRLQTVIKGLFHHISPCEE